MDKTIFTTGHDETGLAIQTSDGCYVIGNMTDSGVGGYKTQPSWGSNDYWIVKFCDTTQTTAINSPAYVKNELDVSISPNPFTADIAITIQKQNLKEATFTITNILGETLFTAHENNLRTTYTKMLTLSWLAKGVYMLEVTAGGEKVVRKIVKE